MSQYRNQLAEKTQTIRALYLALASVTLLAVLLGLGWMRAPSDLRIHIPPDISSGAVLEAGAVGTANVYAFAFYIWQQLNRWESDGAIDYEDKIHSLRQYLTPACFQNRLDDFEARQRKRELDRRVRALWEIPGRGFAPSRVQILGNGTWTVSMDTYLQETLLGAEVKARYIHYPIRVVRFTVDPEQNPFGLALDCLADKPQVIDQYDAADAAGDDWQRVRAQDSQDVQMPKDV